MSRECARNSFQARIYHLINQTTSQMVQTGVALIWSFPNVIPT